MSGTNVSLLFTLQDKDGKAVDITTDSVQLTVRTDYGGSVVFSQANGTGQHSTPAQGQTIFILPRDTIAAAVLARGTTTWVYEVRRVDGANEYVHVYGEMLFDAAVGASS